VRECACLILAAGAGTRMKSDLAKVLHPLCGKPLVRHAAEAARQAGLQRIIVVVGHQADQVRQALAGQDAAFVLQAERKGTGHAVMMADGQLRDFAGDLLVLYGDVPLIRPATITSLLRRHREEGNACTMLTTVLDDAGAYGRVVRDDRGLVARIVENKDASPEEKAIREINPAIYCFDNPALQTALREIEPNNRQGEYYLTDVIGIFRARGLAVAAVVVDDSREVLGINTPDELAACERHLAAAGS
jgi:bifunctional UDP-N-acetylglucosamine pyrophosphorylase/glucosamine-1-phosphate N-acetyltransferase